jgi:hypothetical protein
MAAGGDRTHGSERGTKTKYISEEVKSKFICPPFITFFSFIVSASNNSGENTTEDTEYTEMAVVNLDVNRPLRPPLSAFQPILI